MRTGGISSGSGTRQRRGRGKALAALVLSALAFACASLAAAPGAMASCTGSCTWTGETAGESGGSLNWSSATNWSGGEGPGGAPNGTLTFPALTACPSGDACYAGTNDLTGLSADGMVIDDRSPYRLEGNAITLGSGGIVTTAVGSATSSPFLNLPITLGADQTWRIDGGTGEFPGRLVLQSPVTGAGSTLGIELSHFTILNLAGDNEVGAVTVTGDGTGGSLGFADPGTSSLNATDGNPVSVTDADVYTFYGLSLGPLTFDEGTLQLGAETATPKVSVAGPATLGQTSGALVMGIAPAASPTPGTDYSQLSATGDVSLGNSSLGLFESTSLGACTPLTLGVVYTLVQSTGGTVSGRFAGAPDGSFLPVGCGGGEGGGPMVRIDYHPASVVATVVESTTTTLSSSTASSVTNQPVTLIAEVATGSGSETPTGTVEFDNRGTAIPGCSAQPLDPAGAATCGTSFVAGLSPQMVTATYDPAGGSGFAGSTSVPPTSVAVGQDATTTVLSVSDPSPDPGQSVTFAAAVTPAHAGPAQPSGSMQFLYDGTPIPICTDQPLEAGASSSTATCTVSFAAAESHRVTASYTGDVNFAGSTSSVQTVTAKAPAPQQQAQTVQPTTPSVPQACSTVQATAAPYSPTTFVKGAVVPGLRTRLSVGSPSDLQVRARVAFRRGGKTHTANLGQYQLHVGHWRNLRLPLPRRLRSLIPRGQKTTLLLGITASPDGSAGCPASPTAVQLRVAVRVVNVLAG
jgi:hypothetical protein